MNIKDRRRSREPGAAQRATQQGMFWPFIEIDKELSYCPLADFGAHHVSEGRDLYAKAVVAQPLTGHLALHNAALVTDKIVMMQRGVCDFVTKVRHAQDAGAIAVIVANTKNDEDDDPNAAFVMDAGSTRRSDELGSIHIPAVMISHAKAAVVFDHIHTCYLDRQEFALTIKFLGANAAAQVMETLEKTAKQKAQRELAEKRKEEMERQQIEATKQLQSRLQHQQSSSRSSTSMSTPSSTPRASPKRSEKRNPRTTTAVVPPSSREASFVESSYETSSIESRSISNSSSNSESSGGSCYSSSCYTDNQASISIKTRGERSRSEVVPNHWCPMTTALLIMDVQNYFCLHQDEKCLEPHASVDLAYYKRISSVMVPTIQDVLLASRASEGIEVVYSVVESATRDGRDRSRAHKHAGIHIAKGGFGAKILTRIAPSDNDIAIPRTGINVFESTNLDYTLRNMGVSHIVVLGISTSTSLQVCIQSALDKGYQKEADQQTRRERMGGGMKDMDAQDELLAHNYAHSHLKQHYDEVVVDDSRGIGGFLWKFPSEGSNNNTTSNNRQQERVFPLGAASIANAKVEPAYPRKCAKCQSAWVSDRAGERRHRKGCPGSPEKENGDNKATSDTNRLLPPPPPPVVTTPSKLGIARRVWCEVDSTLSRLQWREDIDSEQDVLSCPIPFLEILQVELLHEPANSFQIVTSAPRTVVFQFRPSQDELIEDAEEDEERAFVARKPSSMDAQQWCEYLDLFSQYARQQKSPSERVQYSNQQHSPTSRNSHNVDFSPSREAKTDVPAFDELVFARITRAVINEDVEALETMTSASSDQNSKTHLMLDESGNSLLIVALKLGAGQRIIRMLLDAGVDCNAKNSEEESPLLLVAASGDDEMLQVLLQVDSIVIDQPCSLGATAFHAAANAGDLKILEMLCEAGTLTSAVGANGWTALHYAAACPTDIDAMHFLCELIPDLTDCQCDDGNTALHVASGYGCVENVRALLQTAANPHIQNFESHTAYHVALHSNKIQCAVAINEYMANSQELYAVSPRLEEDQEEQKKVAATATTKDDFASPPSIVQPSHLQQQTMELFPNAWVEYSTPDGLPYFYNTSTGASSWHKPQVPKVEEQRGIFGHVWDDQPFGADEEEVGSDAFGNDAAMPGAGQQLSLCLIPMVSLLVSLDDPTAASKIESKRRKAREKRRANLRCHLVSDSSISKS